MFSSVRGLSEGGGVFKKMSVETSFPEVLPYSRNGSPSLVATFERPSDVCKLLGARWMNSQTGRFISRMIQDPHHYVYALNNPINLIDPLGLQATPTPIPTVYPNNLHYDYPIHPNPTACPNLSPTLYPTSIPTPTPTSNPPLFQNPFSPPGSILSHPQQPPPGCSWGYTGEMPSLSKIKKMCLYQNVLINTPQTFCMYEVLICINCRNITAKRLNQNCVGSNVFIVP